MKLLQYIGAVLWYIVKMLLVEVKKVQFSFLFVAFFSVLVAYNWDAIETLLLLCVYFFVEVGVQIPLSQIKGAEARKAEEATRKLRSLLRPSDR